MSGGQAVQRRRLCDHRMPPGTRQISAPDVSLVFDCSGAEVLGLQVGENPAHLLQSEAGSNALHNWCLGVIKQLQSIVRPVLRGLVYSCHNRFNAKGNLR
jgi:hypothetical protein